MDASRFRVLSRSLDNSYIGSDPISPCGDLIWWEDALRCPMIKEVIVQLVADGLIQHSAQ